MLFACTPGPCMRCRPLAPALGRPCTRCRPLAPALGRPLRALQATGASTGQALARVAGHWRQRWVGPCMRCRPLAPALGRPLRALQAPAEALACTAALLVARARATQTRALTLPCDVPVRAPPVAHHAHIAQPRHAHVPHVPRAVRDRVQRDLQHAAALWWRAHRGAFF